MFTNKKFGLSDSLIEATKKIMTKEKEPQNSDKENPKKSVEFGTNSRSAHDDYMRRLHLRRMPRNEMSDPADGRIVNAMDIHDNKTTDIQELTGKGKLPAIKAYHDSKAHDMFNRSDKVDALDPRNRNKSGSRRTVTLKGKELWDRGMAHMRTARRAHDLMYKNKNKLQSEMSDPAGSPAGGRIVNAMDSQGKKTKEKAKADSVEVNPSLKEMTMKERTAFHMAAASAKRLGKSHFMFSGKKFPVKMTGDVAKQMTSEETVTEERWVDIKTKKFVQAPTREKAAELLNTLPLYIRKAPMQAAESVAEGGMPSSIIRSKQRLERLSDADFAKEHDKKSDDDLRAMAWRYGHGKGSNHYVNKKIRGLKDLEAQKTKSVTEEGKMSDAEVTRAHKIGKHFKKKGIGDEPYALATWLTQKKPGAAKKAEKTIKKED